jgi:hypothetical protein
MFLLQGEGWDLLRDVGALLSCRRKPRGERAGAVTCFPILFPEHLIQDHSRKKFRDG